MRFVRTSVVVVLLVLSVVVGGCDSVRDTLAGNGADGATGTEGSESGAVSELSETGALPDDFPGDVPIHDGEIVRTFKSNENVTVALETSEEPSDVYDWCLKEVEDEGWSVTAKYETKDGGTIAADKGDRIVQYTLTGREKGTGLVVFTGPKAE